MDAADTRGQLSQASFPNQPILPKPPTSVTSPTSLSFIPQFQSSPGLLPATPYQLASYPMTNSKFAVLLPTLNPFMMDSSSATQPGLIPVFGKDPKEIVSPGVAPLGMDTRPFLWKPIPWCILSISVKPQANQPKYSNFDCSVSIINSYRIFFLSVKTFWKFVLSTLLRLQKYWTRMFNKK